MQNLAEHGARVVGWALDLARPMRAALDEEVHWLFEALDEALALAGEAPAAAADPPPIAVVWRDEERSVRLIVLRGEDAPDELATAGGRRLRIGRDPAVVTLLTQGWTRVEDVAAPTWSLRARGGAPGTLALLFVASRLEDDASWARGVASSLRYAP